MESSIDLEFELVKLTLSLYNNPLIPRKVVQFVIDRLISFVYNILIPILIQNIKLIHKDHKVIEDIKKIINACRGIVQEFKNERQRFNIHKEKGLMIDPPEFEIDAEGKASGMFVPLKLSLTKFF